MANNMVSNNIENTETKDTQKIQSSETNSTVPKRRGRPPKAENTETVDTTPSYYTPSTSNEREVSAPVYNPDDIRLDKKITVRSIAPWTTGSVRRTTVGDITISPMGTVQLSREEVIAQGQNGNVLLTGTDGVGSHATWYINDDYTRQELSFDVEGKKQTFITESMIRDMFDLKNQKAFEAEVKENVVTRAEKHFLLHTIKRLGFNDYSKIAFCEEHCGRRISDI